MMIKDLAKRVGITDCEALEELEELVDVIEAARGAYEVARYPQNREVDADELDEVAEHLERAALLLDNRYSNSLNRFRLDKALGADASDAFLGERSNEIAIRLSEVAAAARRAHRGKSEGQPREAGLFEAAIILAEYWKGLGKSFHPGQWFLGFPKSPGPRFVYDALTLITPPPYRGLKSVVQEIAKLTGTKL
jgi:hypothetical protein